MLEEAGHPATEDVFFSYCGRKIRYHAACRGQVLCRKLICVSYKL
jgi:hypothetical protein